MAAMSVDLAQCSLGDLAAVSDDEMADVLERVIPSPAAVPVAAFNSAIG